MPKVKRMPSAYAWDDVVRVLNACGPSWTVERLCRSVGKLVAEKMAEPQFLERSPPRLQDDRLVALVAAISATDPDLSPRDIAAKLECMRARTLQGGVKLSSSSVNQ